ncbi:MAG: hypothetical protein MHMPM18_000543 [Marteilia pararefringens]
MVSLGSTNSLRDILPFFQSTHEDQFKTIIIRNRERFRISKVKVKKIADSGLLAMEEPYTDGDIRLSFKVKESKSFQCEIAIRYLISVTTKDKETIEEKNALYSNINVARMIPGVKVEFIKKTSIEAGSTEQEIDGHFAMQLEGNINDGASLMSRQDLSNMLGRKASDVVVYSHKFMSGQYDYHNPSIETLIKDEKRRNFKADYNPQPFNIPIIKTEFNFLPENKNVSNIEDIGQNYVQVPVDGEYLRMLHYMEFNSFIDINRSPQFKNHSTNIKCKFLQWQSDSNSSPRLRFYPAIQQVLVFRPDSKRNSSDTLVFANSLFGEESRKFVDSLPAGWNVYEGMNYFRILKTPGENQDFVGARNCGISDKLPVFKRPQEWPPIPITETDSGNLQDVVIEKHEIKDLWGGCMAAMYDHHLNYPQPNCLDFDLISGNSNTNPIKIEPDYKKMQQKGSEGCLRLRFEKLDENSNTKDIGGGDSSKSPNEADSKPPNQYMVMLFFDSTNEQQINIDGYKESFSFSSSNNIRERLMAESSGDPSFYNFAIFVPKKDLMKNKPKNLKRTWLESRYLEIKIKCNQSAHPEDESDEGRVETNSIKSSSICKYFDLSRDATPVEALVLAHRHRTDPSRLGISRQIRVVQISAALGLYAIVLAFAKGSQALGKVAGKFCKKKRFYLNIANLNSFEYYRAAPGTGNVASEESRDSQTLLVSGRDASTVASESKEKYSSVDRSPEDDESDAESPSTILIYLGAKCNIFKPKSSDAEAQDGENQTPNVIQRSYNEEDDVRRYTESQANKPLSLLYNYRMRKIESEKSTLKYIDPEVTIVEQFKERPDPSSGLQFMSNLNDDWNEELTVFGRTKFNLNQLQPNSTINTETGAFGKESPKQAATHNLFISRVAKIRLDPAIHRVKSLQLEVTKKNVISKSRLKKIATCCSTCNGCCKRSNFKNFCYLLHFVIIFYLLFK